VYVRPRCRSPRHLRITKLILGVLASGRHCAGAPPPAYCCINQTTDTLHVVLPHDPLYRNATRRCDAQRTCSLLVRPLPVPLSPAVHRRADYVIIVYDCVDNSTGHHRHQHHAAAAAEMTMGQWVTGQVGQQI